MLVRLEHALDCPDLAKQMLLVPRKAKSSRGDSSPALIASNQDVNLVVGYNGSARSQTALDLILWIAHQTRLTTQRVVTVQVVYVIDSEDTQTFYQSPVDCSVPVGIGSSNAAWATNHSRDRWEPIDTTSGQITQLTNVVPERADFGLPVFQLSSCHSSSSQFEQFEKADRILWQARHLAEEWRGSLETHLRFGNLIEELRSLATQVSTTALMLGCSSAQDPLVQALGKDLPFPILGIPPKITVC